MRNEEYERGYWVAAHRASNRTALGLPLDRPSTDAEIKRMARIDRAIYDAGTRVPTVGAD